MPDDTPSEDWTPILAGVVGSHAYNLNRPGSDVDRLRISAAPTAAFLGLNTPTEHSLSRQFHDPDIAEHEAGKALRLLLGCNPTVTELLWLAEYEVCTDLGQELLDMRRLLLSAERVRGAYLGYATQQFQRLQRELRFPDVPVNRIEKHARHLLRLVDQGTHLWATGDLVLRVDDPARYFEFGRRVAEDPNVAGPVLARAELTFKTVRTMLPDQPSKTAAERWLRRVRDTYYTPGAA